MLYNRRLTDPQHRQRHCVACGLPLTSKDATRPRRFCSDRCRDAARRQRNHKHFGVTGYRGSGRPRISKNNRVFSKPYKPDFRDRGSGIRGPIAAIEIEILAGRSWRQFVSPAGVECPVTIINSAPIVTIPTIVSTWSPTTTTIDADLIEIPDFLRRTEMRPPASEAIP